MTPLIFLGKRICPYTLAPLTKKPAVVLAPILAAYLEQGFPVPFLSQPFVFWANSPEYSGGAPPFSRFWRVSIRGFERWLRIGSCSNER
jgi:hypothetical protein